MEKLNTIGGSEQWKPITTMVVVNFVTGMVNALIKKTLDGGTDHMIVATYRLAISAIFLAPIAFFWERKSRAKITTRLLCELFFSALVGTSLTQYFFLLGLSYTSATLSCAFLSMSPAITFILALLFRLEKVSLKNVGGKAKIFGTMVCIGGALLLSLYKGVALTDQHESMTNGSTHVTKKAQNWVMGSIFLFIGITLWSSWLLIQARINMRFPSHYTSITILSLYGAIQSALLSLIKQRTLTAWILRGKFDIITILYAGVVGQGISTVAVSWCIKQKGPVFTSSFTPLMLIFASIFDFTILREQIFLGSIIGSILVIIGLYIFLWGKKKDIDERLITKQGQIEAQEEDSDTIPHILPITTP